MEIDLEEMDDVIKGCCRKQNRVPVTSFTILCSEPEVEVKEPKKNQLKLASNVRRRTKYEGEKKTDSGEPSGEDAGETRRPDQITQYVPGDLISAQMKGYPSWPAMIDIERQNGIYFKIIKENTHYNVRFFDEPVTRAWVAKESIKELRIKIIPPSKKIRQRPYSKRLFLANVVARGAAMMSTKERMRRYSLSQGVKRSS